MASGHRYEPPEITVRAGEQIVFANDSSEAHSVTAYERSVPEGADYFSSGGFADESEARDSVARGLVKAGERFEVTLEVPGTYRYFCVPHEADGMKGTIVVEEDGG